MATTVRRVEVAMHGADEVCVERAPLSAAWPWRPGDARLGRGALFAAVEIPDLKALYGSGSDRPVARGDLLPPARRLA